MTTVKIRYLGSKKTRIVDLPVGLASLSKKTGEVCCNPVGEFTAQDARKLLSLEGVSALFALESESQAGLASPRADPAPLPVAEQPAPDKIDAELAERKARIKEKQRANGIKLAALAAAKRAAAKKAAANPPSIMTDDAPSPF